MEKRITNRYKKALSLLLSLTMLFSIILQAVPLADAGVVVDYFPYKYAITDNASSDLNIDSATYSGTLHVVYERGGNIYYKKNLGAEELVGAGNNPSISVGPNDIPQIAYENAGNVVFGHKSDTWTGVTIFVGSTPDIDVDSSNYAHIVFKGRYYGDSYVDVVYATNTSGNFVVSGIANGLYTDLGGSSGFMDYYESIPVIKIDSNGKYHLLTQHHNINKGMGWIDHAYYMEYITNASGKTNSSRGGNISPNKNSLSLSDDGTPRIAFSTAGSIYYATVDSAGNWSESAVATGSIPSITTSGSRIGISYTDSSNNIQYVEDPGTGTFGSPVLVDTGTSSSLELSGSDNYVYYIKSDGVDDEVRLASSASVYTVPGAIETASGSFVSLTGAIELSGLDVGGMYMLMSGSTMVSSGVLIAAGSTGELSLIPPYFSDFGYYPITLSGSNNGSAINDLDTKSFYIGPVNYAELYNNLGVTLDGLGIANNFTGVTNENVRSYSPLYFENPQFGKILFSASMDLTNSGTIAFLQNLPSYLNINNGYIDFNVGSSDFANYGAQLFMYFTGSNVPEFNGNALDYITAKSATGAILNDALSGSTLLCAVGVGVPYQVCTFANNHFTSFDFNPYITSISAGNVKASNSGAYNFSGNASENLNGVTVTFSGTTTGNITTYLSGAQISGNSFASAFDMGSFGEGIIYYSATPVDTNMNAGLVYTGTISKDTVLPTLSEITPVSTPTTDSSPNLVLSSSELADPSYTGGCSSSFGQFGAGNNTITLNTLADGTYDSCYVRLTDTAGNDSLPLRLSSFTIDTTPPTVGSIAYDPFYLTFTSGNPTISATINDATTAIAGCQYTSNGVNWNDATWTPDSLNNKTGICSHYFSGLGDGLTYGMNMRATDSAGNTGIGDGASKTNDTVSPTSLADTGSIITNTGIFSVGFTGSDARSGIKEYRLYYRFNAGSWVLYGTGTSSPLSFDISANIGSENGNGTYDFYTIAEDNVGNLEDKSTQTAERTVLVDTLSPTGYVSDPTTHGEVKGTVSIGVSTEDYGSYIKEVCLNYGTGSPTNLIACKNLADKDWNSYNYAPSFGFTWDTTLVSDGNFNLYAIMTDNAGNTGTTNPVAVIINNYSTGSSSENPAYITTCQEFQNISAHPGWYYKIMNDIDCSETSTWNSGRGFQPITNFDGTVDGYGYNITGIYQNVTDNGGIFAWNGGALKRMNFKGVNMRATGYMGGVTNHNSGLIEKSSITGNIVCGYQQCGGFAGINNGTISESWADLTISGGGYIGIIAGHSTAGNIINSYAKGKITATSDSSSIVGLNQDSSHLSYVYSVAQVIGDNEMGGLIGWQYQGGSQAYSYWDVDTSGKSNMCGTDKLGGGACDDSYGLTDAQMKTQESFSGWNFSSIWAINPNINDGYPYLINNHDITPPEYLKAETIARNKILVYFNEDLNGSALNINDFKVDVSGNEYTISSLSETGGVVTLNLSGSLTIDTPTVIINPNVPATIKDLWGNIEYDTVSKTSIDKVGPSVIKLGDGNSDYTLGARAGDVFLDFSEEISESGKNAIQSALNAQASKAFASAWSMGSKSLAIGNHEDTPLIFANDVIANVTDMNGNVSTGLLLIDSSLSSDVSISSSSYTINNTGGTISNVPYGTSKTTFLAALSKGYSGQTWIDTGIASTVVSNNTLIVKAEDGETTKTFTVTVNASSNGGGGDSGRGNAGGGSPQSADYCPNGDYTNSYYDGSCGTKSTGTGAQSTGSGITSGTGTTGNPESGTGTDGSGSIFSDITGSFAYDDILFLVGKGVIKGYPDGTFRPNGNTSRGEFLVMVMKSFDIEINPNDVTNFTDIPNESEWMIPYIAKAKTYGINGQVVNGKAIFRPNDPITRIEALAMLFRIKGISTVSDKTLEFEDEFDSWMIPYAIKAKELGIMNGQIIKGKLMMRPNDHITRAETVRIIIRVLDL